MPSVPRRDVVDESTVGTYHVFGRAARQEFLLGLNPSTEWHYGHRKDLFYKRLEILASVFSIDCLDSDVLDNHFHLLLRNRPEIVRDWTDRQVAERWLRLNRAEIELRKPPKPMRLDAMVKDARWIAEVRRRLSSISWFMAYLREPLARVFNFEDERSGHFWERFGCVRLPDVTSLLACSLYLAMNPFRAGTATSVETSEHTSVRARLLDRLSGDPTRPHSGYMAAVHIDGDGYEGVAAGRRPSDKGYLPISFDDFLEVVDHQMRRERAEWRGEFVGDLPSILERLGIDGRSWEATLRLTSRRFSKELDRMIKIRATAPRKSNAG